MVFSVNDKNTSLMFVVPVFLLKAILYFSIRLDVFQFNANCFITYRCLFPGRLYIQGDHFYYNGQRVFFNGVNQAWVSYGYDWGNNQYQYRRSKFQSVVNDVKNNGGNSIRMYRILPCTNKSNKLNKSKKTISINIVMSVLTFS